ncbi:hypothetical protein [Nocardia jejuensis]|uniref:hypothetical protein n=1 Tax=Nocardia jejuensis TaxID=328049 RepID=UPI0014708E0C|nr:hypothetical protein [Nocardia jejuensis]
MTRSEWGKPSEEALRTLDIMGDIEWFGLDVGYDDISARRTPPHMIWRYKTEPPGFDEWVRSAVSSFAGKVKWTIDKPGRNWVLLPQRVMDEVAKSPGADAKKIYHAVGVEDPVFAEEAISDLRPLFSYLRSKWGQ